MLFAKKMGCDSAFLGAFGSDKEGTYVKKCVEGLGIDITHCRQYQGENGAAYVTLQNGERIFLGSNQGGILRTEGLRLQKTDYEYLKGFDLIHSGLYGFAEKELKELHKQGCHISYDFSNDFQEEQLCKILPIVDYAFFSTSHLTQKEREELSKRALNEGCLMVLCTCGVEGAYLYTKEKNWRQLPHYVEAKDTMAAGDAFLTSFLITFLQLTLEKGKEKHKAIHKALEKAAEFSANQCLEDGSFGYGKSY